MNTIAWLNTFIWSLDTLAVHTWALLSNQNKRSHNFVNRLELLYTTPNYNFNQQSSISLSSGFIYIHHKTCIPFMCCVLFDDTKQLSQYSSALLHTFKMQTLLTSCSLMDLRQWTGFSSTHLRFTTNHQCLRIYIHVYNCVCIAVCSLKSFFFYDIDLCDVPGICWSWNSKGLWTMVSHPQPMAGQLWVQPLFERTAHSSLVPFSCSKRTEIKQWCNCRADASWLNDT
jgi:hypothetical protein